MSTLPFQGFDAKSDGSAVRRFRITVVAGPEPGRTWESTSDTCSIGSHPSNDVEIHERTVSRFHCEIRIDRQGPRIRDLESRNGTIVDGVRVDAAHLRTGSLLQLGGATLRFDLSNEQNRLPISERTEMGGLVGRSVAMRACFALLERAAQFDSTVLLEGESGTGKTAAAEAIHEESARKDRPFVVLDCGAVSPSLVESELFGHVPGAFTGASAKRLGVFGEAQGGTVLLDEIGELPLELQPKLLRVLQSREVRPVGAGSPVPVDVRVIAATHRNLRADVNAGRFRHDLFFRLAVVRIVVPPLRQRPEDIPALVDRFLGSWRAGEARAEALRAPLFLRGLQSAAWPGNVRELQNHLEQCLVWGEALAVGAEAGARPAHPEPAFVDLPYAEARHRAIAGFERQYVTGLMELHQGNVVRAAQAAGVTRQHFYRLLRRHGIAT
jgi:two-component system, NtrC family, response regulator GlrR